MRHTLARYHAWLLLALVSFVCLAGAWAISTAVRLPAGDEFNFISWELRHLPGKWLYLTGRFFQGGLSREEQDERLGRYLLLTSQARALQRSDGDSGDPARLLRERDELENDVEAIIEGRVTAVLGSQDLESSLLFLPALVFPPVDFELARTPLVLSVSPRDRIELAGQRPLRAGLRPEEVERIESDVERGGKRSAFVDDVGGVAAYPSIVVPQADYALLVELVAHEWVHQYLFFRPLGRRYFDSQELQTLNETVASIAGRDLAALVVQRYSLSPEVAAQIEALAPPAVDAGPALRELRIEVERLLDAGQTGQAEALMERRRQELAAQGVRFRRINQAFFASRGVYADDPASIDPIGGKLAALRAQSNGPGAFLREAARLTSEAALDRLLAGG
ncbi:MAG: hypothetical protein HY723_05435 [Chloroflexi bacterium]|nr:hypothetical protein [Chloroflexota bacterium]